MVGSGVLKRAEQNEYRIFSEKVNGRKNNLENEMNNIWTNFDYDEERISRYFEETDTGNLPGKEDEVLEELAPIILDSLYHTKTTGAFLILPGQDGTENSLASCIFVTIIRIRRDRITRTFICWPGRGTWPTS